VPPAPAGNGEADPQLQFLEPNLAFSLAERASDRVEIRIHFGAQTWPPWLQGAEEEPAPFDYFVHLDVAAKDLARSAEFWMRELAEFPER
jgi:hypothetical protein